MESTFHIVTVMGLDTREIRHEIREYLKIKGRSRGKAIADHVIFQGVGSEKTVYREIKEMTQAKELEKFEHNRANIEYELVDFSKTIDKRLKYFVYVLDNLDENLTEFENDIKSSKKKPTKLERLMFIVTRIKQLQTVETLLHILETSEAITKSKVFLEHKKRIDKFWKILGVLIFSQPEEEFSNEVFRNFTTNTYGKMIPLEK